MLFIGHSERVTGPALALLAPAGVTAYLRRAAHDAPAANRKD
jgi:chemotaxis protein methyltransferase CheR